MCGGNIHIVTMTFYVINTHLVLYFAQPYLTEHLWCTKKDNVYLTLTPLMASFVLYCYSVY